MDWCVSEQYAGPSFNVWLLNPDPAARIAHIDTYSDLAALVAAYPGPGVDTRFPDWEAVSRDYDAVHLTDAGQWATRLSHPHDLYGWDCESTLWFRWCFISHCHLGTVEVLEAQR
jgi:hypothetical protein